MNYRTFLVPYDFSEHAHVALSTATDLAKRLHANLHLLHVLQIPSYGGGAYFGDSSLPPAVYLNEVREGVMRSLQQIVARVGDFPGTVEAHVTEGAAIAEAIHQVAEQIDADLLVMGTHGRTGLTRVFLGSVTERTLRQTRRPVLTVQAAEEEAGT